MATSIIGSIQVPRDTKVTIDVDTELSPDSQNPIANSAVYEAVQKLQSQIEDINSKLDIIVVDELPTQDIDANAIYLVPLESEDEQNKFTEYIYIDSKWEKIGTYNSSVNLSQYLTKVEAESTYVKQTDIPTHLPNPEALTIKYNGTITFTYDGSTAETGNFIVNAETVPLSASDATTISNKLNTLDSKLADLEDVYSVNLTDLLAAEDSGSISTAIGGIDNLNAAVTKNQNIIGTVANGKVSVSIRNLGKVTSLYYILDTLAGYTVNEINITNTDGTLSKTVVSHSMMTEEMVIDNLTTSQSTLPLSANQGKILNETKQNILVSGTNIKTINGNSLLGEGNIEIQGGGSGIADAPSDDKLYGRKNGQWSEVTIPTVPTKTSQLENDSNFVTSEQLPDVSDMLTKTEASNTYQTKGDYLTSVPQAGQDVIGGIKVNYAESDKNYAVKLDGEGRAYVTVNWTSYSNATVEQAGLMSKDDKSKLDKIPEGASKVTFSQSLNQGTEIGVITINDVPTTLYAPTAGESVTYGQATDTSLGLVKIGYTQNGTNYPVQLDGDGKMFVSVTESSDLQTLKEQVAKLMAEIFPLSLTASGGGNYEQGTSQTVTITWNLTQGGDQVTPDSFTINNEPVTFSDKSKQYTQVTTNTTYVVKATVGDETLSKTLYARFYSPRYWGVVGKDFEPIEATIKGLQKLSISSSRSYSRSGISLVDQKICYAYPKSFGALTAIKDGNNFDNLGSYAQSEITVDGVAYYVYLMKDPVSGDGITQNYS